LHIFRERSDMSQKRKESRISAVLPVRIARTKDSNGEQVIIAHTYEISPEGARLGGVQEDLSVGEIVTLDRRGRWARFSVCWKAENGIFGLQCLEPDRDIWDLESEFEAREKEKLTEENQFRKSPNRFSFPTMLRWTTAKVVRSVQ
jgi:hypothetical protein